MRAFFCLDWDKISNMSALIPNCKSDMRDVGDISIASPYSARGHSPAYILYPAFETPDLHIFINVMSLPSSFDAALNDGIVRGMKRLLLLQ